MTVANKPTLPAFGFLTVVEQPEWGLVGGYLVVNAGGRPLEFHCTAPVKANRTQEILYGRTLRSYLCGEQIGPALLTKAKLESMFVLIDDPALFQVRDSVTMPVAFIGAETAAASSTNDGWHLFEIEKTKLVLESRYAADHSRMLDLWQTHGHGFDLTEPFDRIRAALEEAQKSYRPAA
jgi:hypothetical protein